MLYWTLSYTLGHFRSAMKIYSFHLFAVFGIRDVNVTWGGVEWDHFVLYDSTDTMLNQAKTHTPPHSAVLSSGFPLHSKILACFTTVTGN